MTRLRTASEQSAGPFVKELFDEVKDYLGFVPNLLKQMANSPAVLKGYISFSKSLQKGKLDKQLREQIALAVAKANDCEYCVSAHTALGRLFGVPQEELIANLRGTSDSPKVARAIQFSLLLVAKQGKVSDHELESLRQAGFSDEEISEIIATVGLNMFSNFFNHVAQPELDFPVVDVGVNELLIGNV